MEHQLMRRHLVAYSAATIGFLASVTGSAAQEVSKTACLDIIGGIGDIQPILLNRCNGQTWILTRSGRRSGQVAYRWTLLGIGLGEQQREPENSAASAGKCFTFQGRRFCE
jgi:hypothetical protein